MKILLAMTVLSVTTSISLGADRIKVLMIDVSTSPTFHDAAGTPEVDRFSYEKRFVQPKLPKKSLTRDEDGRLRRRLRAEQAAMRARIEALDLKRTVDFEIPELLPDLDDQSGGVWTNPQPRQVTNFGYQLGERLPGLLRRPPATTGRRRGCAAVVQSPNVRPTPYAPVISRVSGAPSNTRVFRPAFDFTYLSSRFSCSDGIDNNGNGAPDRFDPVCWLDRMHPASYAPELSETGFAPIGISSPRATSRITPAAIGRLPRAGR